MIRIKRTGFATEMKPKIFGNNLSLEYDNIESSLMKVGADILKILSGKLIDRLVDQYLAGNVPEPIRIDIDNEIGKNHRAQADKYIKEYVAGQFLQKARSCRNAVDLEIKKRDMEESRKNAGSRPFISERTFKETDKFCLI